MAVFLIAVLTVLAAIHYYLWRRLVRNTTRTRRGRRIGTAVMVGLGVLVMAAFVGGRILPRSVATALSWPGYLWLAVMFYLVVVLAMLEIPALLVRLVLRQKASVASPEPVREAVTVGGGRDAAAPPDSPGPAVPPSAGGDAVAQSRRLFLARTVAITAGATAVGLVGSGVSTALGAPELKRIQIPLAKLPRSADGLRIALVSDIHLGPLLGYSHTRRVVDMINAQNADIVAIVGDLVDGSVAELGQAASPLRELRSRLGAYFVTGNHEYFSGADEWVEEVAQLGIRPLRNERVEVAGIDLAGVNDATGASFHDGPDFDRALAGRDPSRAVVMLAHQPIQASQSARYGVDLQLSGHTHGGQIAPFNLIVRATGQPIVTGLGEVDGMPVYVTNGAGFWGPPVRVGAPPDITVVELRTP